jgi:hypothetical protein
MNWRAVPLFPLATWTADSPIGCNLTPCVKDRWYDENRNDFNAGFDSQKPPGMRESSPTLPNGETGKQQGTTAHDDSTSGSLALRAQRITWTAPKARLKR